MGLYSVAWDGSVALALKFLGRMPSQRAKVLAKLGEDASATLILRARYLCMISHRQLLIAQKVYESVVRMGYRAAAEHAARTGINTSVYPALSKVVRTFNPHARPRSR
jgi:tRNA G26 N,N-dimethylase Trm1